MAIKISVALISIALCLGLYGCTTISRGNLDRVQLDMPKAEVFRILGEKNLRMASASKENNVVREVWNYVVIDHFSTYAQGWNDEIYYLVVFDNNKLSFYGRPEDYGGNVKLNMGHS